MGLLPPLILASSSPFRRELLSRLQLPFESYAPDIDESSLPGESPSALVQRLAENKARAVESHYPEAIIIGSDQVAVLGTDILGKPGNHQAAIEQLEKLSGQTVHFHTGLCVINTVSQTIELDDVQYIVKFRELDLEQIERYLIKEQPYNCAGSFKSEGLGVTLFEYMEGGDPTALIGLPLIRLTSMLNKISDFVLP